MRPLLLAVCALAFPSAALAGSWAGTWADDDAGTKGAARLSSGRASTLQLDGAAFGCAQPVVLRVRLGSGRISGSGHNVPCNHGARWSVSGPAGAATIHVRLADGSDSELRLVLRERRH